MLAKLADEFGQGKHRCSKDQISHIRL